MKDQTSVKEGSKGQINVPNKDEGGRAGGNSFLFATHQESGRAGGKSPPPCTEKAGEQTKMPHFLPPESVPTQGVHSQSRSKDRSGSFRHKACTSSSDSNSLSDANNEIVRHPGCWLIPVKLEGIETLAVIDTGASVSMMG